MRLTYNIYLIYIFITALLIYFCFFFYIRAFVQHLQIESPSFYIFWLEIRSLYISKRTLKYIIYKIYKFYIPIVRLWKSRLVNVFRHFFVKNFIFNLFSLGIEWVDALLYKYKIIFKNEKIHTKTPKALVT